VKYAEFKTTISYTDLFADFCLNLFYGMTYQIIYHILVQILLLGSQCSHFCLGNYWHATIQVQINE